MRLSFSIVFLYLITAVLAGGLRGAYERIYLWYAYQAEIAMLNKRDGNLDALTICRNDFGTGDKDTLTFNEFIEFTNRDASNTRETVPAIDSSLKPPVDSTARKMASHRGWVANTWQNQKNVIGGASYESLLERAGAVVWQAKSVIGGNHPAVLSATDAIQKVVISRKIDYEEHRMPAMESAPEFTGDNKVNFVTWDVVLKPYGSAREFDLQATIAENPGQQNIAQRVKDWVRGYHADTSPGPRGKTVGQIREGHANAIKFVQRAENMVVRGTC